MKNKPMRICNETIHPGERLSLALPLPELFSCAPIFMPIKVLHGKHAGPTLLITAAMHGNELNGTEIINRLLSSSQIKKLHGTLICVPILNVYGLVNRSRTMPGGIELDRCFPGSANGTHASRVAHVFTQEIFDLADACIDLQTGFMNYTNLPQVYINPNDNAARQMADAFNAPVISHSTCEPGMLRTYAQSQNKPFLMYEAGEAMRFDERAIKVGKKGILNVMRQMGMLSEKETKSTHMQSLFAEKNIWVRASASGISHSQHHLGQHIKKGEALSVVRDPFGAAGEAVIRSEHEAVIVGMNNLPLVHEGEALFQLAIFPKMAHAAGQLGDWQEVHHETSGGSTEQVAE